MKLKTIQAPDLGSALATARRELGPDALVLATNTVSGRLGLTRVEITVAVDRSPGVRLDENVGQLAGAVQRSCEQKDDRSDNPGDPSGRRATKKPVPRVDSPTHDALRAAVDALTRTGLSADLARRFATIASRQLAPSVDAERLVLATEHAFSELVPFTESPLQAGHLFVVGPPGSGKTSTVAKLAARLAVSSPGAVVFAQADSERVGSLGESEIYCNHIGAKLAAIDCAADLGRAVQQAGPRATVIVDTAGVGASDDERLESIAELRECLPDAAVAVTLPNGLHREEAARVIRRFKRLKPTSAALTKVDDGRRLGDLVTAVAEARLPLSFVTNGHRIPDDLQPASPRGLAAIMLRAGMGTRSLTGVAR